MNSSQGRLRVAVGGLVAAGVVTAAALVGPLVAVQSDESLSYGQGVLVTFLTGGAGAGAGAFVSASAFCDGGLWFPGTAGLVTGVTGTVIWGVVASSPGKAATADAPGPRGTILRVDF